MQTKDLFQRAEKLIINDRKLVATLASYVAIFLIFMNLTFLRSPILGVMASLTFFLINGIFLGQAFFQKEKTLLRLMLGSLLLIAFLGLVSWAIMIIYNLDDIRSAMALFTVATISSVINKFETDRPVRTPKQESSTNKSNNLRLHVSKALYLLLIALSFILLLLARSDEIYTVWQYMHPMFIPLYFATTFLLLNIIFSSEKTKYKLLFVIIHSILSHSFFVIIFPAGDISGQQLVLGRTRLVFDNVIMDGWPPWHVTNVLERIFHAFRGINFQTAFSVIFARMFSVDVYWTHMLLIPILYGTFVPTSALMTTKALGANEKISVLSALLLSLFPATVVWGNFSVPNSLGYIFFAAAVPFYLKYLSSDETKNAFLMIIFSITSFVGHALTGIVAFSLVLLALAFKRYEDEKHSTPRTAKAHLVIALVFCTSLIPLALVYLKFFYPIYTYFSLTKIYELTASEFILLLLFGQTIKFQLTTALIYVAAPLAGLLSIVYVLYSIRKQRSNKTYRTGVAFLFLGILMFLAQHRILNLFMTNVPFPGGRLWMFRDFMALPFVAIFVHATVGFLQRKTPNALNHIRLLLMNYSIRIDAKRLKAYTFAAALLIVYLSAFVLISGWITISLHRAYPHYGPLQTTTYELEAARYIDQATEERYIVICDQWFIFAAEMLVGVYNPNAYYFTASDPQGVSLFLEMKREPSEATMIKAMQHNNASVAYFVIEKPRLGTEEYNRIKSQALQNSLQTYPGGIFYHQGEEKLYIFYHKKS